MIATSLADVARVTGGRLAGGAEAAAVVDGPVVIDSRQAARGALFVCLPGEHVDGHDFAAAAVEAGAVAALAEREVDAPAVVVADTQTALGLLATDVLNRAEKCTVVGVTGSSGKTSTKDLLAAVFGAAGPTVAPENSFNNEIGLPLTVLRVDAATRTLVAEYSARGAGHIAALCAVARPSIAIVLNVGTAHLGEFGSREAIATAKGELVEALPADGVAVLLADDPIVAGMADRTNARVVTFGEGPAADVRVDDVELDDTGRPRVRLHTPAGPADLRLGVHGAHQALNAAAVVAAALAGGLDLPVILAALESAGPRSPHRMSVQRRPDGLVVIDDAYNANPESTRAAIDALGTIAAGRRRWAVLGEMRELGPESAELHREVGAHLARSGVDELVVVGPGAPYADGAATVAGWRGRTRFVGDATEAARLLRDEATDADVVLVKASNALRLWTVADALLGAQSVEASA